GEPGTPATGDRSPRSPTPPTSRGRGSPAQQGADDRGGDDEGDHHGPGGPGRLERRGGGDGGGRHRAALARAGGRGSVVGHGMGEGKVRRTRGRAGGWGGGGPPPALGAAGPRRPTRVTPAVAARPRSGPPGTPGRKRAGGRVRGSSPGKWPGRSVPKGQAPAPGAGSPPRSLSAARPATGCCRRRVVSRSPS